MEGGCLRLLAIVLVGFLMSAKSTVGIRFVIDREECFSHSVEYEGDVVHVSFVVIKSDTPWHYSDDGVDLVQFEGTYRTLIALIGQFYFTHAEIDLSNLQHCDHGVGSGSDLVKRWAMDWMYMEDGVSKGREKLRNVKTVDNVRHEQGTKHMKQYIKGPGGDQIHDLRDKTSEKFEFTVHRKGLHRFCFTNKSPYHETIDFDVHVGHFAYYDQHAKDEHFAPLLEQIAKLEEALYNIQFEQHWLEAQTDRQALVNEGLSRRAIHKAIIESVALIGASVLQIYLLRRLFERKLGTSRV
ncbi:Transmembrane emp24 domain-containing protein p24beta2 [Acorus calamus]|uniref:Transmembrane emp24 domain-containing protein p24beta2 n=1 Tax=Acorus calamus TaxID=4465 RepID=A0AAV9EW24_ACOCL|nr:Transmembrane emp24 domain-containing protein p24beta2 [Acorus calamus]